MALQALTLTVKRALACFSVSSHIMFLFEGISVIGQMHDGFESILTKDALDFLAQLHCKFNKTRKELLAARDNLQKQIDVGTQIKVESYFDIQFKWSTHIPSNIDVRFDRYIRQLIIFHYCSRSFCMTWFSFVL